jgi:hypothetical protein
LQTNTRAGVISNKYCKAFFTSPFIIFVPSAIFDFTVTTFFTKRPTHLHSLTRNTSFSFTNQFFHLSARPEIKFDMRTSIAIVSALAAVAAAHTTYTTVDVTITSCGPEGEEYLNSKKKEYEIDRM